MKRRFFIGFMLLALLGRVPGLAQQTGQPVPTKFSTALAARFATPVLSDSIDLVLALKENRVAGRAVSYRILHSYDKTYIIRVAAKQLAAVVKDSTVLFADVVKPPKEELTTGALDLAVNKLNTVHARFPAINGAGILASIKEQQLDTTDIDYTGRYVNTHAAAATFSTHASIMATTLAGAGNSSPFARGAAPAALVTSTSFESLLPEPDAYYQQFQIAIQNHSYGTVPENYYGAEAAAYDRSVAVNPTMVHVFSSGNSGLAAGTGPYAGLQGWSNLTGNFKTAKNSLVVGAIDSFYRVAPASSKGPAFDGRIKPDLVAFGEDGSSGAAALTSGAVALLQQAYRNQQQQRPSAALVKAVLLNSADDIAQKGPDYASGYGSLNGYNAVKTILQNHFFEDAIEHGGLKKFTIRIPPNATQLKVTLAWTDSPAPVNASKALVNDLNLVVENSKGESWLPWVLNAAPVIDAITRPAIRRQDTINNVEQISIDTPQPGIYTVMIRGSHITTKQPFAVAYQIDTAASFEWTFPTKQDAVTTGQTAVLRWQTTSAEKGLLEYDLNNSGWQSVSDTINLQQGYYKWNVPDTLATAQFRMRVAQNVPVLTDTLVISKAVVLKVGFDCADSVLLFWNALPAAQYQVYRLGEKYLEPVMRVADTAYIFKPDLQQTPFYSVAPVIHEHEGLKSYTINYKAQGVGCYFQSFYVQSQSQAEATFTLLLGTAYNVAAVAFQKLQNGHYDLLQMVQSPQTTTFTFSDTALKQGANTYRVEIKLQNGAVLYSNPINVYHVEEGAVLVYPNPAAQQTPVTVITNKAGLVRLVVYDISGRPVLRQLLSQDVSKLVITALPKGMYLIQSIEDDGTRHTQKLVVY